MGATMISRYSVMTAMDVEFEIDDDDGVRAVPGATIIVFTRSGTFFAVQDRNSPSLGAMSSLTAEPA